MKQQKCIQCDRKVTKPHPDMIRKDIPMCDRCSIPSSWIEQNWAKCNCPSCK